MNRIRQVTVSTLILIGALFVAVDLALVTLPPAVAPLTHLIEQFWLAVRQSPGVFMTFILWQLLLLYTIPVSFWAYEFGLYLWKHYTREGVIEQLS